MPTSFGIKGLMYVCNVGDRMRCAIFNIVILSLAFLISIRLFFTLIVSCDLFAQSVGSNTIYCQFSY